MWTLFVPEGNYILLRFSRFDIEPETFCDYDSLSVYSEADRLVGELPSPCSARSHLSGGSPILTASASSGDVAVDRVLLTRSC